MASQDFLQLQIIALTQSETHPGQYALILEDLKEKRRLPIIIGQSEAQAIAIELEKMTPGRPQTHDLLHTITNTLGATLTEVYFTRESDELYHARLHLQQGKELHQIDARPSDAVALAIRAHALLFCNEKLMQDNGFAIKDERMKAAKEDTLLSYSLLELEVLLSKALEKEDYESAARLRDFMRRKKETGES